MVQNQISEVSGSKATIYQREALFREAAENRRKQREKAIHDRTGKLSLSQVVNAHRAEFRHCRSWEELHDLCADLGCRCVKRGRGFVITTAASGDHKAFVKLSDAGIRGAEKNFGAFVPAEDQKKPQEVTVFKSANPAAEIRWIGLTLTRAWIVKNSLPERRVTLLFRDHRQRRIAAALAGISGKSGIFFGDAGAQELCERFLFYRRERGPSFFKRLLQTLHILPRTRLTKRERQRRFAEEMAELNLRLILTVMSALPPPREIYSEAAAREKAGLRQISERGKSYGEISKFRSADAGNAGADLRTSSGDLAAGRSSVSRVSAGVVGDQRAHGHRGDGSGRFWEGDEEGGSKKGKAAYRSLHGEAGVDLRFGKSGSGDRLQLGADVAGDVTPAEDNFDEAMRARMAAADEEARLDAEEDFDAYLKTPRTLPRTRPGKKRNRGGF